MGAEAGFYLIEIKERNHNHQLYVFDLCRISTSLNIMYCPQCSTESSPGVQYCRVCGANLKVIGKAVALSEAIARTDRGPLPKIKEMVRNLKVEHVTEEVSRALEHMNHEIAKVSPEAKSKESRGWGFRRQKTPAEKREKHITNGIVSLFWGTGVMIFLYYLTGALVLKLPPHILARIPFELDPVVRVFWLIGLVPALSGLGNIVAGLLIRPGPPSAPEPVSFTQNDAPAYKTPQVPGSVTERTTNLLEQQSNNEVA